MPAVAEAHPTRAIVVLLDSLNRHLLGAYGGSEFATPNLDAFARRAQCFRWHYAGSLPCIPARHDLLCGTWDFLWKPWGSIEIWEEPITAALRAADVTTVLVTDHPHLFEVGGENYHTDFAAWDYQRGHESDPWKTRPDPSWMGAPSFHRGWTPYDNSRGYFRSEEDFPGPRTMAAAARWIERHAAAHDRFLLVVDEFDPHEPFDTPEPYASLYDASWEGPHLIWPPYVRGGVAHGILTQRQARQVRACYGAKLTMIDHWFGRLIDAIERNQLWDTTAVMVCTDHGHYLGEKDIWGKPWAPVYEPLGHIPLMIAWPGLPPGEVAALTTTVDIHATLLDLFGVGVAHRTHGRSLAPLLRGEATAIRDHALSGVWGREVHLIAAERGTVMKYVRGSAGPNAPLSMWSNRWSTMPVPHLPNLRLPRPDHRAFLDRMPGSNVPVIRQPFQEGDLLPFWALGPCAGNHLYDLQQDPAEEQDLAGAAAETRAAERLRAALADVQAPDDQLVRLGFA
jgi:arylsulfatase A-like enzyme